MAPVRDLRQQQLEHFPRVADHRHIGADVLADLGRVDIDVDDLRLACEAIDPSRRPVVEPGADVDQQVGLVERVVDVLVAVHPHHAERERVRLGKGAEPQQSEDDRDAGSLDQAGEEVRRAGEHDAVPGHDQRPLRRVDRLRRQPHLPHVRHRRRLVAAPADARRVMERGLLEKNVLWDVDQHRPRAAGGRQIERFLDRRRDLLGPLHEIVVLGDRQGDAGDVDLLKGVAPDQRLPDLPRDGDDGDGVEHRVREAGDEVGGARPGGRHADARLTGDTGVAFGGERRPLLEADEHVVEAGAGQGVVERDDGTAGVAEDGGDTLRLQAPADDLRPGQAGACRRDPDGTRSAVSLRPGWALRLRHSHLVPPFLARKRSGRSPFRPGPAGRHQKGLPLWEAHLTASGVVLFVQRLRSVPASHTQQAPNREPDKYEPENRDRRNGDGGGAHRVGLRPCSRSRLAREEMHAGAILRVGRIFCQSHHPRGARTGPPGVSNRRYLDQVSSSSEAILPNACGKCPFCCGQTCGPGPIG